MTQSPDEKRRDEVLKRMLATPPKPHAPERKPTRAAERASEEDKTAKDQK